MKSWLFNPWNDIALARDVKAFTPPPVAVSLARAGQMLPLWMASDDDTVICDGVDATWLHDIKRRFGLKAMPWNHDPKGLEPEPWGWSAATLHYYEINGFKASQLPDKNKINAIRQLSHRRTAAAVSRRLRKELPFNIWPEATEINDELTLRRILAEGNHVVKAPWSSSGRGISFSTPATAEAEARRAIGTIRKQGCVMVENAANRITDFAMLFIADGKGKIRFEGYSLFETSSSGEYTSNIIDTQDSIKSLIIQYIPAEQLLAVQQALTDILADITAGIYSGPVGVDMLISDEGILHPVVEINFRYTMGFVALALARRLQISGKLSIAHNESVPDDNSIILSPPSPDFTFYVKINQ
ncbi:MAG: hypothetical protein NC405_00450 [Odoribacter sp.]|nr:hypothetical protein [Odoribacter sp.]